MAEVRIQSEVGYETVDFNSMVELPAEFESFAIVRDPVARLKSAWSNRVRENIFERHGEAQAVKDAGLPVSPTFSKFVEHLELYRQLSRPVRRHTESYTRYLGDSLARFDRIFRIENMRELEAYLTERAGFEITIPKEDRSSKKAQGNCIGDKRN